MATVTVPPPDIPNWSIQNIIGNFTNFWQNSTHGYFIPLLAGLFVLSVFLKTRSLSATLVAAAVTAGVVSESWLVLVVGLALAGLIWAVWQQSRD
ncbi:MAG: hypothetical protein GSR72_00140 [Desulfurococcales archaeon]|nr:hypothetical protein [Desulfurococcales archaeon]